MCREHSSAWGLQPPLLLIKQLLEGQWVEYSMSGIIHWLAGKEGYEGSVMLMVTRLKTCHGRSPEFIVLPMFFLSIWALTTSMFRHGTSGHAGGGNLMSSPVPQVAMGCW